jgi:hypothetical protein
MGRRERGPPSLFVESPSLWPLLPCSTRQSPVRVAARIPNLTPPLLPFPLLANEKGVGTGRIRPYPAAKRNYTRPSGGEPISLT